MNANKFDQLTFENLNKYPQNTIDFFIDKFGFADENEFVYHLGRIYGSMSKAKSIFNSKKKKAEKDEQSGKRRSKKFNKSKKQNALVDDKNACADEVITGKNPEETPELSALKDALADDQKMLEKISSTVASESKFVDTLVKNCEYCSNRVRQLELQLQEAKKIEALNLERLHKSEKQLSENTDMKAMLIDEIEELKSKIQNMEGFDNKEVKSILFFNQQILKKNK